MYWSIIAGTTNAATTSRSAPTAGPITCGCRTSSRISLHRLQQTWRGGAAEVSAGQHGHRWTHGAAQCRFGRPRKTEESIATERVFSIAAPLRDASTDAVNNLCWSPLFAIAKVKTSSSLLPFWRANSRALRTTAAPAEHFASRKATPTRC